MHRTSFVRTLSQVRILTVTGRAAATCVLMVSAVSCNPRASEREAIASDLASIAAGETSFVQNCSACHSFKQDGIGPQLGGITAEVSPTWIRDFIKGPRKVIESGDARAVSSYESHRQYMPSFAYLTDAQIDLIIAYMNTQKAPNRILPAGNMEPLGNPVPDSIAMSDLVFGLDLVARVPSSSDQLPRTRINKLDFEPSTHKLFVLDLRGKLYQLQQDKPPVVYLDLAKQRPNFIDEPGLATGFGSFAFHPEFAQNGLLYTTHTESPGSGVADFKFADSIKVTVQWVLTEWITEHPEAPAFTGKSRELLRINMVTGIHGVQEITFNPLAKPGDDDYGLLYAGVGDGGAVEEGYPFVAHSLDRIWGTIIRIDPRERNSANGTYGIPPQNPFTRTRGALGEIYAYGFRNPHRITWLKSGQMVASNIGQHNIESVNIIRNGGDYGWPIREGTFQVNPFGDINVVFPLTDDDTIYHIIYPVAQYDHDEGNAISGGFEYEGTGISVLAGKYFFGDIMSGRIFYIATTGLVQSQQVPIKECRISFHRKLTNLAALCGTDRVDLRFGRDADGELYVLTKPDGSVYKVVGAIDQ